ncbi:MAG TPA: TetR family transcriptional regulator [Solirubrobacteraceae bacterium]|nr:TetR family transcriptional regulator [Solirubrobacteraceae bacterium]
MPSRSPTPVLPAAAARPVAADDPAAPARPRGPARRVALLEATLALLAEHGADALTHRRVAEHAGLPLASTTYWFDSKEHLLTEALRYAAERDAARLRSAAESLITRCEQEDSAPTASEIVAVVLDPCHEESRSPDPRAAERAALLATYALMLEAARRPALQALSLDWSDAYRETVGELLRRAGSGRAADDARILMAAADGLLIDRLASGTEGDLDPRAELEHLTHALLTAGAPR